MSEYFIHLKEDDYPARFPVSIDSLPIVIQKRTFIDAWLYNTMAAAVRNIQSTVIQIVAQMED